MNGSARTVRLKKVKKLSKREAGKKRSDAAVTSCRGNIAAPQERQFRSPHKPCRFFRTDVTRTVPRCREDPSFFLLRGIRRQTLDLPRRIIDTLPASPIAASFSVPIICE